MFSIRQIILLASVLSVACGGVDKKKPTVAIDFDVEPPKSATAILLPTADSLVTGIVEFTCRGEGISVIAEFQGLEPGQYCFRIHEVGDCSDPYAESAGGYFCPEGSVQDSSGKPNNRVDDYENVMADENGCAIAEFVDESLTLKGPYSIVNRSVIIETAMSGLSTDSSERSCQYLACGVIEIYLLS